MCGGLRLAVDCCIPLTPCWQIEPTAAPRLPLSLSHSPLSLSLSLLTLPCPPPLPLLRNVDSLAEEFVHTLPQLSSGRRSALQCPSEGCGALQRFHVLWIRVAEATFRYSWLWLAAESLVARPLAAHLSLCRHQDPEESQSPQLLGIAPTPDALQTTTKGSKRQEAKGSVALISRSRLCAKPGFSQPREEQVTSVQQDR